MRLLLVLTRLFRLPLSITETRFPGILLTVFINNTTLTGIFSKKKVGQWGKKKKTVIDYWLCRRNFCFPWVCEYRTSIFSEIDVTKQPNLTAMFYRNWMAAIWKSCRGSHVTWRHHSLLQAWQRKYSAYFSPSKFHCHCFITRGVMEGRPRTQKTK